MQIARVNKKTNIVENIEVVSNYWLEQNSNDKNYLFIPVSETHPPIIGSIFSENDPQ